MRSFYVLLSLLFVCLIFNLSEAAESEAVDTGKVIAQLGSDHNSVAPGDDFYVALHKTIDPKWHTYWYNPGDSGEPVQIDWRLPAELEAGEIIWPLPRAIPTGPLINYGFDDTVVFPVPFKLSESAQPGEVLTIEADVYYLVCEEICIPEDTVLSFNILVGETDIDGLWQDTINRALNQAPKDFPAQGAIETNREVTRIIFTDLPEGEFDDAYFFPWEMGVIEPSAPQKVQVTEQGVQIETKAGYKWADGTLPSTDGVLRFIGPDGATGIKVKTAVGDLPDIGIKAPAPGQDSVSGQTKAHKGIFFAVLGAFIGGLILNIFPCVFPVISLKALSLAKIAHGERAAIRKDAWAYTFGILFTFLILTLLIIALRSAGNNVGWGFQLQNPVVVGMLTLLLFLVALNLLGVFEVAGGFQNIGQSLTEKDGVAGSFFTGALAVIVATPCTAPFMAGSVGWAMTQPPLTTVIIFMALGFGFAFPFLLLAYIPFAARLLPKPGTWMVRFKEFLAFPMLLAVAGLMWVLASLAGSSGVLLIGVSLVLVSLAIWLFKINRSFVKWIGALILLLAFILPFRTQISDAGIVTQSLSDVSLDDDDAYYGIEWSPENVQTLRSQGYAVFVDFTASWCVNCKVNEIRVLKTDEIKRVFKETKTAFLIADWTKPDDRIAAELSKYGRVGIPFYQLFPPGNNDVRPEILPQTLTKPMIKRKLQGIRQP